MQARNSIRFCQVIWIGIWVQVFLLTPTSASQEDRPLLVMLTQQDPTRPSGFDVVRSHLVDLPVTLTLEARGPGTQMGPLDWKTWAEETATRTGAGIVFWVDPTGSERLWLYVHRATGPKLSAREIGSPDDPPNRFESMATIVRAEARTLLESRQNVVTETEIAPTKKPPPPPNLQIRKDSTDRPSPARMGIDLSYGLTLQSTDALMAHGIRAGIRGYLTDRICFLLGYRFQLPTSIDHRSLTLEVTSHPLELGGALRWHKGANQFYWAFSALIDRMSWRVDPNNEQVKPGTNQRNVRFALSPSVGYSRQLTGRIHLFAAASLDLFVYQRSLTVEQDGEPEVLFEPWTTSPYLQVGLLLDI
jgi:hypothetical protein